MVSADARAALALFALVFVTHSLSPSATSGDSRWVVPQMASILSEGDADLDEFRALLAAEGYAGIDCVDARRVISPPDPVGGCSDGARAYARFPFGVAAIALAPMIVMDAALRAAGPIGLSLLDGRISAPVRSFLSRDYVNARALTEMALASFIIGLAAAVLFLTAREFLRRGTAVAMALLFAYATPAWSTGSRALWQHGPEMLMLALAIYLLVAARRRPRLATWTAAPLILAYFIRPTGGIALAALGLFVLIHRRRSFFSWTLVAAATAAPFVIYNYAVYGLPLQPYFTRQAFLEPAPANLGPFLSALAGQLFSPSRGLFVFSPFLVLSIAGMYSALRLRWQSPLTTYLTALLALHWIAISAFADWTAGFCFGPRYFSDVTPVFLFFLIPAFQAFEKGRYSRPAAAFAVAALIGFGIHLRGAVDWNVQLWNEPDVNPARAWDWKDPQFLRGL